VLSANAITMVAQAGSVIMFGRDNAGIHPDQLRLAAGDFIDGAKPG
jgi:hypothetical protein